MYFPEAYMLRRAGRSLEDRPQCIAHRGYSSNYPENTLTAFQAAIDAGADAIETDVHLTSDLVAVLSHDASLKRCFGIDRRVSNLTWPELSQLKSLRPPSSRIPRLDEFIQYMNNPQRQQTWILLDLKVDDDAETLIQIVAAAFNAVPSKFAPWPQRVLLGCWTNKYLELCFKYMPTFPVTYTAYSTTYTSPIFRHENVSCIAVQIELEFWPAGLLFRNAMRRTARPLLAWMVHGDSSISWCLQHNLDAVVVDNPRHFFEIYNKQKRLLSYHNHYYSRWVMGFMVYWLALIYGLYFEYKHSSG